MREARTILKNMIGSVVGTNNGAGPSVEKVGEESWWDIRKHVGHYFVGYSMSMTTYARLFSLCNTGPDFGVQMAGTSWK